MSLKFDDIFLDEILSHSLMFDLLKRGECTASVFNANENMKLASNQHDIRLAMFVVDFMSLRKALVIQMKQIFELHFLAFTENLMLMSTVYCWARIILYGKPVPV